MRLSNVDILEFVNSGDIIIDPFARSQLQPSSYDLRLGGDFYHYDSERRVTLPWGATFKLWPGETVLATTVERVALSAKIDGDLTGKSSVGRKFVMVQVTAGFFDPGWDGEGTLEMVNLSRKTTVDFTVGQTICQMRFQLLRTPADPPYQGHYKGQKGATQAWDH